MLKIMSLVLSVVICLTVIAPSALAQQSLVTPHKAGSLIVLDKTIFLVGYGSRRGFPTLNEFLTYNYRRSRLVNGNSADRELVEGPPMRAKSGTLVLDTTDNRTIYLIGKKGEKRAFTTPVALQKYRKKKTVVWRINLSDYPLGENME